MPVTLPRRGTRRSRLSRFAVLPVAALALTSVTVMAPPAQADLPDWVVIDNGTVQLGINNVGDLNVPAGITSAGGTFDVGLRLLSTNNEATAPGCLCEGWGLADNASLVSGYANESTGRSDNLAVVSFTATASSAVSTVRIADTFEVTHDYHPAPATPNLYEVTVTVKNVSGASVEPRYRRVMDWDVEPTAFSEYSTIQGTTGAANVLFASDDGFASADPLSGPSSINFTGDAVDNGPSDHGALFDFGFPSLPAGESFSFKTFYGGAATEAGAAASIGAVGAEVYSFGQPSTEGGQTLGTPNTFVFAFAGVGGAPQIPQVTLGSAAAPVGEGAGQLVIPVNLNTVATSPVTVRAATADGSAAAPGDYTSVDTTVTIPTGQSSGSITIPIVEDSDVESDETFSVSLSSPSGAVLGSPSAATVTITDNDSSANRAPVASDQTVTTPQNTGKAITLQASDADNDPLSYAIVGGPTHGTLTGTGANRTYTPNPGYTGPDAFTFRANDGRADSNTATVSITVAPVFTEHSVRGAGKVHTLNKHGKAVYKFKIRAHQSSSGDLSGRAAERTPKGWFRGRTVSSMTVTGDKATVVYKGKYRGRGGYTLTVKATDAKRDRVTLVITRGKNVVSRVRGHVRHGGIRIS